MEESYFCSKTNSNVYITFDYQEEYFFSGFKMTFLDFYQKARPKIFNVIILDNKKIPINTYNFTNNNINNRYFENNLNNKGRFLKYEFLENFGEKYFCIERMYIYINNTYSIEEKKNAN